MKKWFKECDKAIVAGLLTIVLLVGYLVSPAVAAIIEDARFGTLYINRTSTLVGNVAMSGDLAVSGSITATGGDASSTTTTFVAGSDLKMLTDAGTATNTLASNGVLDGEYIADDTVDNDSIDWGDMTDLDTDGAVSWGNIAEGELANSTVISADIKDDSIVNADINSAAAIAHTKLAAVEPTYILVGNASSQAVAVAMSSDGTMDNAGALTLADNAAAASEIGAGTLANDVVFSNATATVTASNGVFNGDMDVTGDITGANLVTATAAVTGDWYVPSNSYVGLALVVTNDVTLGSGAASTVTVDSASWDVAAGDFTGLTGLQTAGDVDFTDTGGSSGSADFDTAGYVQHAGTVEVDGDLLPHGAVTGDGSTDVSGMNDGSFAGKLLAGSLRDVSLASAQTATNGAPILLEGLIVQLNSTGGTNLATNTITLTGLGTGTNGVFFVINTGTSNHLAIAQSGTWKSAAVDIGESEALVVVGNASAFYGVE